MSAGQLFILSAPSGAGKTSLARALMEQVPGVEFSISHTTREARAGEQDAVDYYFVGADVFEQMIESDQFLEHARVYGNYYGTAKQAVNNQLEAGKKVLLDIDWQGARSVKQAWPAVKSIFISPPSVVELETRLRDRGLDEESVIQQRMQQAVDEISHYDECDYVIINGDFDRALQQLIDIVAGRNSEHSTTGLNRDRVKRIMNQAQTVAKD